MLSVREDSRGVLFEECTSRYEIINTWFEKHLLSVREDSRGVLFEECTF
jgi:hypothetical protein